jgi:lycopene beta-cyclase
VGLDADVIILGGGCAGLSLAVALGQRASHLRVKTVESRSQYERDRTWCFWNTAPHPFSAGVTHRWHSWRVRNAGTEALQQSRHYAYECLPADRFYDLAADQLRSAGQELLLGVDVQAVRQDEGACAVETTQGVLRSRWIFDSRPRNPYALRPWLLQRFAGWHVRTTRPCFDPSVVDLMDFQPGTEHGRTLFFYVLPFSPTEALVEATYLDDPTLPPADAEAALRQYLHPLCGDAYEVLYREAAVLPMGERHHPTATEGRVFEIGARGGRIKASSGYAFQRIQRQSAALADALRDGSDLPQRFEPHFYAVLDRIFLAAQRRSPDRVASYFMTMFRKLPADVLVRFLSENASLREVLQVMLALPKADFISAALLPEEVPAL